MSHRSFAARSVLAVLMATVPLIMVPSSMARPWKQLSGRRMEDISGEELATIKRNV